MKMIGVSFLAGALSLGAAWDGAGLVSPPGDLSEDIDLETQAGGAPHLKTKRAGDDGRPVTEITPAPGEVLAGASKISIEPRPEHYGGTWVRSMEECRTISADDAPSGDHLASAGSPWPENPNCIYMGGFGLGPMNPVTDWDQEYGLWVRSFAVKGPNGRTLVTTIIDGEGYFWDYESKCDDCGIKQIAAELAADPDLGLEKEGIVIAATHAHSAPDFIGGWGFVPDWYMEQVADSIKDSVRNAVTSMEPARLEVGEVLARAHNSERRDTYRSAEEQQLTWLRAVGAEGHGPRRSKTIATIGAFAGHPTTRGTNGGVAHADWPALFEKRVEDRFGGVGLLFMTGLGNMSTRGGTNMGAPLGDLVAEVGGGIRLENTEVEFAQQTWAQPTTNVPLTALGVPGFFDRAFLASPAEVRTGKSPDTAPCASASPSSVELAASAARIGDGFALSAAPGEIFSNVSNTIKEQSGAAVTMPIGQANDALGYMPQSFELHPVGQQGLGFVAGGAVFVNYEDAYSIDRCVGDKVLEETIAMFKEV
ncbi:MAG: hypothetical protein GEU78_12090 [Actinobacteria bacterium]|nr:hypothetical protein [Actinomycetota bacterium]